MFRVLLLPVLVVSQSADQETAIATVFTLKGHMSEVI